MGRTVVVEVTAEDIAKGKRDRACECPIAIALQRICPEMGRLGVFRQGRSFGVGTYDSNVDPQLPDEAADFVRDFDVGNPVEPFTFTVELL